MPTSAFNQLPLAPALLDNLQSLGFKQMTEIQSQSLPTILEGRDVIGQGKTGSGKTVAFGLGLLHTLNVTDFRIQSLVLCPTRELADQVAKALRKLARTTHNIKILTLCGGMPFGPQIGSLEHGAHIIVGTPGRVEEHVRKGTLKLDHVKTLVLDEADRMLEMGFQESLDAIIERVPNQRQTLLFSATYPEQIQAIASRILHNPLLVKVDSQHSNDSIKQHFFHCNNHEERLQALRLLLLQHQPQSTVVFCNTKKETQQIADELWNMGFSAIALHGDLEQKERDQALVRFANKSIAILVATDVAARGLDIEALDAVINFHMARDPEVHVHRIGRTGRAGSKGIACTLFSDRDEYKLALLQDEFDARIAAEPLPDEQVLDRDFPKPTMATLQIDGGKKQKLRPGDILGALTAKGGIQGKQVGKIHIFDNWAYVAVEQSAVKMAMRVIEGGKMKGRQFRIRYIR